MISRPAHMGTRAAGPGDVLPATASAFLFFPTCRAPSPCLSSPPWLSLSPCLFPTACRKPYPLYSPFSVFFDHRFNMCGLYILGKRRTHLNCGKHTYIYILYIGVIFIQYACCSTMCSKESDRRQNLDGRSEFCVFTLYQIIILA